MPHLEHDIFLLMLNLAQLNGADRILTLFVEALNSVQDSVTFGAVTGSPPSTANNSIPITTTNNSFGYLTWQGQFSDLAPEDRMVVRNAVKMAAIILENNRRARLLDQERQRLEEANQELRKLSQLKDQFVANVSHELRSPITSLKMRQYLLEVQPDKLLEHMAVIKRETERLEQTIESLLQLSRLDQQQTELNKRPMDLNLMVKKFVSDRMMLAHEQDLILHLDINGDLPIILADEGLLNQVLSVLFTNAVNYIPAGSSIFVSTQVKQVDDKVWTGFSVMDTGPGITPGDMPHLFERFFRGEAGRKSGKKGTGLGLSLAKEIIDRHKGQIEVENNGELGEGVTFAVWLPVE